MNGRLNDLLWLSLHLCLGSIIGVAKGILFDVNLQLAYIVGVSVGFSVWILMKLTNYRLLYPTKQSKKGDC